MSKLLKNKAKVPYLGAGGKELPGVTTVLQTLNKPALLAWAHRQGAMGVPLHKASEGALDVGTITHYLIECFAKQEEFELDSEFPSKVVEKSLILCNLFKEYWFKRQAKLLHSELRLVDEVEGFGGTIDLIVDTPKGREIWDIKTSDKIWPENYIQLAAYKRLAHLHLNVFEDFGTRVILITKQEKFSAPDIDGSIIRQAYAVWQNLLHVYKDFNQLKYLLKQ